MYLIGYDIGSSSIKAALVNAASGATVGIAQFPPTEMNITAPLPGWAEQDPEAWWQNLCKATRELLSRHSIDNQDIKAVGIAYQMHGLVITKENGGLLRPAIIWCDSRATEIGRKAFSAIGKEKCLSHLLNSPGNFTASKLKWVKDHEPEVYGKIYKMMLPGDYIAMKLTGEIFTTVSGLSEGMLWDFKEGQIAGFLLEHYGLERSMLPELCDTFSLQGQIHAAAAAECGLKAGTPLTYRAGDQPNNALSLNVLRPGEVAATGGTSGVVYGIADHPVYDPASRVNGFAHVNHHPDAPRIGILLCINGAGSQYSWMKQQLSSDGASYQDLERMAASVAVGADGLRIIPFGNGAERIMKDVDYGAQVNNLQFNRHHRAHLYRAALEGIAFSFVYGVQILNQMGLKLEMMRVGNDNLFQSTIFSETISTLLDCQVEMVDTTGAVGAARAAGVAVGLFSTIEEAMYQQKVIKTFSPLAKKEAYKLAFFDWCNDLEKLTNN